MPEALRHSLTDEHCACLDRVLERTPGLLKLASACEDCGWDVTDRRAVLEEQLEMARKAKSVFFPFKP